MQDLAAAISSSGDEALAAWQEQGLAPLHEGGSIAMWSIFILSAIVGLAVSTVAWITAWRSISPMARPARIGTSHLQDPMVVLALGGMVALVVGAAVAFGLFQGLSRLAFRLRRSHQPH